MRQFANYFHIAPSFRVSSVIANNMVMKSGYTADKFFTINEVEPEEETQRKAAGSLYSIKVTLAVNKLTDAQKNYYANSAPVIVALLDVETTEKVIIGSTESPAIITLIPGVNHDQLVVEFSSKMPVL